MSELSPNPYPDNVFSNGQAVSWNGESEDGFDARLGVIQEEFDETFPIPKSGERIWLYEPTGTQCLWVDVIENNGLTSSTHRLQGEGQIFIAGDIAGRERSIRVNNPGRQGPITYMCDYPGVESARTSQLLETPVLTSAKQKHFVQKCLSFVVAKT